MLLTPIALVLLGVIVRAAAPDPKSQAHFCDAVAGLLGFHLGDHFVECGGSWPKMPKAFFSMSRRRLTVSSSRRNRAFSSTRAAASAASGPPPPAARQQPNPLHKPQPSVSSSRPTLPALQPTVRPSESGIQTC